MSVYNANSMEEALSKMRDLQFKIVDDGDTKDMEEVRSLVDGKITLLGSWLKKCSLRAALHSRVSLRCGALNLVITIPKLLFSGGATALSFWATSDANGSSHEVRVVIAILSALSTILTSLAQFLRLDEKQYRNQMAAGMYTQLSRRIEMNIFNDDLKNSVPGMSSLLAEIAVGFSSIATFSPQLNILRKVAWFENGRGRRETQRF